MTEHSGARPTPDVQDDELVEDSRQSGGDAPAAGSLAEREAVASDDDELFGGEDA